MKNPSKLTISVGMLLLFICLVIAGYPYKVPAISHIYWADMIAIDGVALIILGKVLERTGPRNFNHY